jgi:ABC-2 type transport system ATP-binding protein
MATGPRSCREGEAVSDHEGQLELTELRRRFADTIALDGLSFTVPRGQVFGFLGPNGAGMTTAMRAIVGVAALDSGWRSTWCSAMPLAPGSAQRSNYGRAHPPDREQAQGPASAQIGCLTALVDMSYGRNAGVRAGSQPPESTGP